MPLKGRLRRLFRRAISGIWPSNPVSSPAAASWEDADHATTASHNEQITDPWDPHAALPEDERRRGVTAPRRPATAVLPVQSPLPFNDPKQFTDYDGDEPKDLPGIAIQTHVATDDHARAREDLPRSGVNSELADPVDDLPNLDGEALEAEDWGLDVVGTEDASLEEIDLDADDYIEGAHRPPAISTTSAQARAARMKAAQIVDLIETADLYRTARGFDVPD